jgi:hypothetical protein
LPAATTAGFAVFGGGTSLRGAAGFAAGSVSLPFNLNASTRGKFPAACESSASGPAAKPYAPPQPTSMATYCSPFTSYDIGAATTPACVSADHNFAPVSALYALNRPSPVP